MIKLTNVSKQYPTGTHTEFALRDVALEIDEGEFVAIVRGTSSGKTTLLNIMGGLDRTIPVRPRLGQDLSGLTDTELATFRNQSVGFVFQHFNLLDHLTAAENVALPNVFAPAENRMTNPIERGCAALGELVYKTRRTNTQTT